MNLFNSISKRWTKIKRNEYSWLVLALIVSFSVVALIETVTGGGIP